MMVLRILCLLLAFAATVSVRSADVERDLARLDSCIQMKAQFDKQKEDRLQVLKDNLKSATDGNARYSVLYRLFTEYESYNFDSAYHYARQAADLSVTLKNRDFQVEAGCAIVFCNLSAGLYKEAFDVMGMIDHDGVGEEYQQQYYMMWSRLYYDLANYNNSQPYEEEYVRKGNLYVDTLLQYVPEKSVYWYYALAQRQMKSHDFAGSTDTFKKMLALKGGDGKYHSTQAHLQAIAYSCIGWNLWIEGKEDEAISNLAESAIWDTRTSTKENTSTCSLANILYKRGDIKRAVSYAQSSMEDANFYGARHRKIQIGEILPIIEQDRYDLMERQRNLFILVIAIALMFIIGLLTATVIIRRQVRKLHKAQKTIDERNHALERTNQSLMEAQHTISEHNMALQKANDRLEEANKIKTVYIGKSFYSNAEYINKVEKLYKLIDRKITARQYEDLRSSLKESTLMAERKNMCADFDETFLKLFPDFVEKFNQLFEEKNRRYPEDINSLTSEMRIFALIRLGVNDSERIANFLDYSVHTVNTYKTRIKNRSIVDNDAFEQLIMDI